MATFESVSCEILLNVYDLHDSNSTLHAMGLGFYHTGVQIRDHEYSFSDIGISRTRPRLPEFGAFREQIVIGTFHRGMGEINNVISMMARGQFAPATYNVATLNCNHFSDALCFALLEKNIPAWSNRVAGIGSTILPASTLQSVITGGNPQTNAPASTTTSANKTGASNNGSNFAAPGAVRSPVDPLQQQRNASTMVEGGGVGGGGEGSNSWMTSIVSWFSGGSNSDSSISPTTPVPGNSSSSSNLTREGGARNAATTGTKKELTDKQKALLQKVKGGGNA